MRCEVCTQRGKSKGKKQLRRGLAVGVSIRICHGHGAAARYGSVAVADAPPGEYIYIELTFS